LFEAEAMRDGRLAGTELASFARHTTVCGACRQEVDSLEALSEALRASSPKGAHAHASAHTHADELRVLRERTRLLAAFDGALLASQPRSRIWRRVLAPATAVLAIAGVLLLWRARTAPLPVPSARVFVHGDPAAIWVRHAENGREKVVLHRGELWIHVEHSEAQPRLVVVLPDGELEDTGTTFSVRAEDGRTTRVAVQEGSVVLRIQGQTPVAIVGGQSWVPERDARPPATPARDRPPVSLRPTAPPRRAALHRSAAMSGATDPAIDFRAAVAVLDVGADREAAKAFARFLVNHPQDSRAEDAAYLRVIALQRCGADDEMRSAAREYLRLYAGGFRHTEMEKLGR
jgi:hypothetical protein